MISFLKKHRNFLLLQAIVLIIFACYTHFQVAGLNDGDSITHYLISRYAWKYPHLLLDSWGKPFFILLSSPFAQFGYGGIQVFNTICAVLTAWLCYRVASRLGIKLAFLSPLFLFFTPVYLLAVPSGLTEILFGLVLMGSIFLLIDNRYLSAAVVLSFLPFCRTEGILILPLFGLYYLMIKQYKAIPLLLAGFVLYSLVGGPLYKDLLWVIHSNPYHGIDVYGHGDSPWTFLEHYVPIFGRIPGIVFVVATLYYIISAIKLFRNKNYPSHELVIETLIIWGSVIIYFAAHSVMWYKGLFGSAGLWRVMAAVAPAFVVICIRGLSWVTSFVEKRKWATVIICVGAGYFVISMPINYFHLPQHLDERKKTVLTACEWVKNNGLQNRKIYYSEPFTKMCLDLDPYDNNRSEELMYVWRGDKFGQDIQPGGIIIWEAGLGPREDQIPLDKLKNDSRFRLLQKFEAPNETENGVKYAVYVFQRE